MNTTRRIVTLLALILSLLISGCEPGQLFSPTVTATSTITVTPTSTFTSTITPTPTITLTPTPIPTPLGGGSGKILFISETLGETVTYYDGSQGAYPSYELKLMQLSDLASNSLISKAQLEGLLNEPFISTSFNPSPDGSKTLIYACTSFKGYCSDEVYIASLDLNSIVPLRVDGAESTWWKWSPDGTMLAGTAYVGNAKNEIYVINSDGSELRKIVESGYNYDPFWSPDGTIVYWQQYETLRMVNIFGSNNQPVSDGFVPFRGGAQFSPDGQEVAFFVNDYSLYVAKFDFSSANKIFETSSENTPQVLSWSHDNQYILIQYTRCPEGVEPGCGYGLHIEAIIRANNGEEFSLGVPDTNMKLLCSWSPDDKFVYIRHDDNGLEYLVFADLSHLDSPDSSVGIRFNDGACPIIWLP